MDAIHKQSRQRGWEEAGSEFYQENYGKDADSFYSDANKWTTLLPSKQTRPATMRVQKHNKTTYKATYRQILQRTCSRLKTDNNTININDGQISMLPDLSEGLASEESMKEEIRLLKSLSVHMSEKKRMKLSISNKPKLRLRGYDAYKWKRRLLNEEIVHHWNQFWNLRVWKNAVYSIQTYFGNGFATYLYLLKCFFRVNLLSFIIVFICTLFLTLFHKNTTISFPCSYNTTACNCLFHSTINNNNNSNSSIVIHNESLSTNYFEPISYPSYIRYALHSLFFFMNTDKSMYFSSLLISIVYFIITLLVVVKIFVKSFREWLIENEGQLYRFCNTIFSSWDFCISNEKSKKERQKFIFKEITSRLRKRQVTRSRKLSSKCGNLLLIRLTVNFIILLIITVCNIFIFLIYNKRFEYSDLDILPPAYKAFGKLLLEHIPPVTIVLVNFSIFRIFKRLTDFEHYTYSQCSKIVIIRTAFFKLTTIVTFFTALYSQRLCTFSNDCASMKCNRTNCFGYYYIDEIYRLIIVYFIITIVIVFLIGYPLLLLGSYSSSLYLKCSSFCQMYCNYEYCLDLIYLQTFCWLAVFYDFTAPGLFCVLYFLLFFINKFECLNKFKIMNTEESTPKMTSIFNLILLVNCLLAISLFVYTIFNTLPLHSCLLSEQYTSTLDFTNLPVLILRLIEFITDCLVYKIITIAVIIVLVIINYCYKVTCIANRNMVAVLKNQLLLEGYDKQFLLDRLNLLLKQHTDNVS